MALKTLIGCRYSFIFRDIGKEEAVQYTIDQAPDTVHSVISAIRQAADGLRQTAAIDLGLKIPSYYNKKQRFPTKGNWHAITHF